MNQVYLAVLAFAAVIGASYGFCCGDKNNNNGYSYPCYNYNYTACDYDYSCPYGQYYGSCGYPGYGYGYGGFGYGGCGGCKKGGYGGYGGYSKGNNKLCCIQSKIATKLLLKLLPLLVDLVQKSSYSGNYNGCSVAFGNSGNCGNWGASAGVCSDKTATSM